MTDLVDFLLARIAEDRAAAEAAMPGPWGSEMGGVCVAVSPYTTVAAVADLDLFGVEGYSYGPTNEERANADHIARWDPARVLAECEAKRKIVALHTPARTARAVTEGKDYMSCPVCDPFPPVDDPDPGPCETLRLLAVPYTDD